MPASEYAAIVVGASFAGLAVARQLRGPVLLLDRNDVGAVQTSACGTPLWVPETLGVASSVLQVHERLTVRMGRHTVTYDLSDVPFCTFDYRAFCQGLLDQCEVRFLKTAVTEWRDGQVVTSAGSFSAPVVVDCSGWRGVVVNDTARVKPSLGAYTFGLEAHTPMQDDKLTFFLDRAVIPRGLGWIFPVGDGSLIGLGSYNGRSKLRPALERYLDSQGIRAGAYHGTYFPNRLGRPTAGRLFAVGDAAGQCLPLTAEGIRPAIYFGSECGKIVQRIISGSLTLEAGLASVPRHRAALSARVPDAAMGPVGDGACAAELAGRASPSWRRIVRSILAGGPGTADSAASSRPRSRRDRGTVERRRFTMKGMLRRYRWLIGGLVVAALCGYCVWLVYTDAPAYRFLVRLYVDKKFLKQTLKQWGILAPIIFIALQALQVIVSPDPRRGHRLPRRLSVRRVARPPLLHGRTHPGLGRRLLDRPLAR